jgi:hypothetical protein
MIGLRAATKLGVIFAIALLAAGVEGLRAQGASQAASESCARASFRVVVDVGHTIDVPGAMSARGIPEYAFNLGLAREIKQALIDAGFEQAVLLITATAPRLGLVERAARANSMHANLFISIHHDSASYRSGRKFPLSCSEIGYEALILFAPWCRYGESDVCLRSAIWSADRH